MSLPSSPALRSASRAAGSAMSVSASSSRRDPPLADAGALHDPLVRRVDERRQLVVREHAIGDVHAEPGDADLASVRDADHDRS